MSIDLKTVAANIRKAETTDLLDRVTVYREEMEPAAVDLMENEVWVRGLTRDALEEHAVQYSTALRRADGTARRCDLCERPAMSLRWGWYQLYGRLPLFPKRIARCEGH